MTRKLPPVIAACLLLAGALKAQGPGGASTNLRFWFKANANAYSNVAASTLCTNATTVAQWNDQTANALHLSQGASAQRPTWLDGSSSAYFNYNPSIKFNPTANTAAAAFYLQRAAPGLFSTAAALTKLNLYIVYYDYDANDFDWLLYTNGYNGFTRTSISMNWSGTSEIDADMPSTSNRVYTTTASDLPTLRTNILAVKSDAGGIYNGSPASTFQEQLFANGLALTGNGAKATLSSITPSNYPAFVGSYVQPASPPTPFDGSGDPFKGEMAELFAYTGSITQATHQMIESYLALKYSAKLYSHDYISSGGTTIFVNSGSYVNSVIGIGRDDNSALYQRQSHQPDDSTRIYISSLATTNVGNAGTFSSNNQFVVMAHNGGQMRKNASTNNERPAGLFSRINREWKVTNTAFSGTFSVDFKLNTSPIVATDLRLLVDDDGNFTNASIFGSGLSFSYSGGVVTVGGISNSVIPQNSTKYITLASVASTTPLPVELLMFTAQHTDPDAVELLWATATEQNNDHFEVERSRGGEVFEKIGEVSGAGTSMEEHTYAFTDRTPYDGTDYYRLKQVDADGGYTYSDVRAITMGSDRPVSVYPNPANEIVYIAGLRADATASITIFNEAGEQVPFPSTGLEGHALDVSTLPRGVYIARIGDQVARIVRQ